MKICLSDGTCSQDQSLDLYPSHSKLIPRCTQLAMNLLLLTSLISLLIRSIISTENYFQARVDKTGWVLSGCHTYKVVIHSNLKGN